MGVPRWRHGVATFLALAGAGGLLLGLGLCAAGDTTAQGWPDSTGFAGFFVLLASAFALLVALFTLVLAHLWAQGTRVPAGALVVLAALGLLAAFARPSMMLLGVACAAMLAAAPFAALQVWLWTRAPRA